VSARTKAGAAAFLVVAACFAPFISAIGGAGAANASTCTLPDPTTTTAGTGANVQVPIDPQGAQQMADLTADQLRNATTIVDTGVSMGLPARAYVIAVATAMQESSLTNLTVATNYDSLGLFQQRPSAGWGTPAQLTDPVYASEQFYKALIKISGWQSLPLTRAAQDVQGSATPDAYAKWEQLAGTTVVQILGNGASVPTACQNDGGGLPDATTTLPAGFSLPAGTPRAVQIAVAYELAQLGKPYTWGGTGPAGYDCSGLVMEAYLAGGITLPRTTYEQVNVGAAVAAADLKPGDLLFTPGSDGTAAAPGHVGTYIGSGIVEEAPYTGVNIRLDPLSEWLNATDPINKVVDIRRIVQ
jgi:cell wall-associated NlpC family hydrolase